MATLTPRKAPKIEKRIARAHGKARKPAASSPDLLAANAQTKTADSKGRVVLGGQFANRAVLIEQLSETEVLVKMARVIPEREAWLYENPTALAAVRKGLAQARAGQVSSGPDLDADKALIAQIKD
jgi:hypothetical protein